MWPFTTRSNTRRPSGKRRRSARPTVESLESRLLLSAAYEMRLLEDLTSAAQFTRPSRINPVGDVVGSAAVGVNPASREPVVHAVLWPAAASAPLDLGDLPLGLDESQGMDLTDRSPGGRPLVAVNGYADTGPRGSVWQDGSRLDLTPPAGASAVGQVTYAHAINEARDVVGQSPGTWNSRHFPATVWAASNNHVPVELPDLPGGGVNGLATEINTSGVIVGRSSVAFVGDPAAGNAIFRAVRWVPSQGAYIVEDLGGNESYATDINEKGQIVGQADGDAFIWLPAPDYGLPQGMTRIVTKSVALGINNHGQVVGSGGFLWDARTGVRYLTDLVPASARLDVSFASARDINDNGEVVVEGSRNGSYQGVILSPVPQLGSVLDQADTAAGITALQGHDHAAPRAAFARGRAELAEAAVRFPPGSATRAVLDEALGILNGLQEAARQQGAGIDAAGRRDFAAAGASFGLALSGVASALEKLPADAAIVGGLDAARGAIRGLFDVAADAQTGARAFGQRDWARSAAAFGQGMTRLSGIVSGLAPGSPAARVLADAGASLRSARAAATAGQQAMTAIQGRNWSQAGSALGQAVLNLADALPVSRSPTALAGMATSADVFIRNLGEAAAATRGGLGALGAGDYAVAGGLFGQALTRASALVRTLPVGDGAATVLANAGSAIRTLGGAAADARSALAAVDTRDFATAGAAFGRAVAKLASVTPLGSASANAAGAAIRTLGGAVTDIQTGIAALDRLDFSGVGAALGLAVTKLAGSADEHPPGSMAANVLTRVVPALQELGQAASSVLRGLAAVDRGDHAGAGEALGQALNNLSDSLKDLPAGSGLAKALARAAPVVRDLGGAAADAVAGINAIKAQEFLAAGASLGSALHKFSGALNGLPAGSNAARTVARAGDVIRNLSALGSQVQAGIKAIQNRDFTVAGASFAQAVSSLVTSVRGLPADSPPAVTLAPTERFLRGLGAAATSTQAALAAIQKREWDRAGTSLGQALLQFSDALKDERTPPQASNPFATADQFVRQLGASATATRQAIAAFARREFAAASDAIQTALTNLAGAVSRVPGAAGAAVVADRAGALLRVLGGAADDAQAGVTAVEGGDFSAAAAALNRSATDLSGSAATLPAASEAAKVLGDTAAVVRNAHAAVRAAQRGLDAIKNRDPVAAGASFGAALTAASEAIRRLPAGSGLAKALADAAPTIRDLGTAASGIKNGLAAVRGRDYVSAGRSFTEALGQLSVVVGKVPAGSGAAKILADATPAIEHLGGLAQAVNSALTSIEKKEWAEAGASFTRAFDSLSAAIEAVPADSTLGRTLATLEPTLTKLGEGIRIADKLLSVAGSVLDIINNLDHPLQAAYSAAQGLTNVIRLLAPAGSTASNVATQLSAGLSVALTSFQAGQWIGAQSPDSQAQGSLGGAAAGALIGTLTLPGLGTVIGALAGGLGGFFGSRAASHAQKAANLKADQDSHATQVRATADFFLPAIEQLGGDVRPLMDRVTHLIDTVNAPGDQQGDLARLLADELLRVVRRRDPSIVSLNGIDGLGEAFMKHLMSRATVAPRAGQGRPLNELEAASLAARAGFDTSVAGVTTIYVTQYGEITHTFANVDRASQQDVDAIISQLRRAGYGGPLPASFTTPLGPGSYGGGRPLVWAANRILQLHRSGLTPEQIRQEAPDAFL